MFVHKIKTFKEAVKTGAGQLTGHPTPGEEISVTDS
jgi:hypothetical protein